MRVVKYTHSCVRLEKAGKVLVLDPGVWSEPVALHDADAVLITHEHNDHADALRLAGVGIPIYAPAGVQVPGVSTRALAAGSTVDIVGFSVTAIGAPHAIIHNGLPGCPHLGYLVDDLYHPGDSVHPPGIAVTTLLVPVHGSWLKIGEAIEFVRSVAPEVAIGIHEAQLNERGLSSVHGWLKETNPCYRMLAPGEAL